MFSIRRKPKQSLDGAPALRQSPSLPHLATGQGQNIDWPKNLVNIAEVRQQPSVVPPSTPGAVKTPIHAPSNGPVSFHKPFRTSPNKDPNGTLKPSTTASDANKYRSGVSNRSRTVRKGRIPPTFNLMVVGGQGTGKTSMLRLLLETADVSPTATVDQRAAMTRFLRGDPKRTQSLQTCCVEIRESRFDRVLFSVIDTPGLDFRETRELKLERQVSAIVKYVDALYADTMGEESKVVRQNKGDQHIHLCIYLVDPSTVIPLAARRAMSSLPTQTRSETTLRYTSTESTSASEADEDEDGDESQNRLTMSPAEVRVIRRLATRVNVLPVIARADSLTDDALADVKRAVRRDLTEAGFDFGVFAPDAQPASPVSPVAKRGGIVSFANGNGSHQQSDPAASGNGDEGLDESERARPVIKLRRPRHTASLRRSRSRGRRAAEGAIEEDSDEELDNESVANVRFSAHIVTKANLNEIVPFAIVAPETSRSPRRPSPMTAPVSAVSEDGHAESHLAVPRPQDDGRRSGDDTPRGAASENGHAPDSPMQSPLSVSMQSLHSRRMSYPYPGPPDALRGHFVRKFRWGTIDVLNPDHCDFSAMRTAVLSTYMKALKTSTREVLYEKYRTEKLLARRVTRNISQDETKRLFEDLGL